MEPPKTKGTPLVRLFTAMKTSTSSLYFRIFCEFYSPVLISVILNIDNYSNDEGSFNQASVIFAFAALLLFIILPAQITTYLCKCYRTMEAEKFKLSHPILLQELRMHRRAAMLYFPVFFLRQHVMVLIVMLMRNTPWMQLTCWVLLFAMTTAYLIVVKPFEEAKTNMVAIVQEISVVLLCLPLFFMQARLFVEFMSMAAIYIVMGAIMLTATIEVASSIKAAANRKCRKREKIQQVVQSSIMQGSEGTNNVTEETKSSQIDSPELQSRQKSHLRREQSRVRGVFYRELSL